MTLVLRYEQKRRKEFTYFKDFGVLLMDRSENFVIMITIDIPLIKYIYIYIYFGYISMPHTAILDKIK